MKRNNQVDRLHTVGEVAISGSVWESARCGGRVRRAVGTRIIGRAGATFSGVVVSSRTGTSGASYAFITG